MYYIHTTFAAGMIRTGGGASASTAVSSSISRRYPVMKNFEHQPRTFKLVDQMRWGDWYDSNQRKPTLSSLRTRLDVRRRRQQPCLICATLFLMLFYFAREWSKDGPRTDHGGLEFFGPEMMMGQSIQKEWVPPRAVPKPKVCTASRNNATGTTPECS